MIYDLLYMANTKDYHEAQRVLRETFANAKLEDASDQIHEHRFSIQGELEIKEYRTALLDVGLALNSLHFGLWMREKPKESRAFVKQWANKKRQAKKETAKDVLVPSEN